MKRFGGFKVAKVLRELQRGKRLVSSLQLTVENEPLFLLHFHVFGLHLTLRET